MHEIKTDPGPGRSPASGGAVCAGHYPGRDRRPKELPYGRDFLHGVHTYHHVCHGTDGTCFKAF